MTGLAGLVALPSAASALFSTWWRAGLGFILAAGLCLPLGYCKGQQAERAAWTAKAEKMRADIERVARAADALAVQRSVAGEAAITNQRKEIDDAVQSLPDQGTSARQRATACVELRRQARSRGLPDPAC